MEYDKQRYLFFTKSYVAFKLLESLRKKYSIPPKISSVEWLKLLAKRHTELIFKIQEETNFPIENVNLDFIWAMSDRIEQTTMPDILKLARELKINEKLFRIFVIYNNVPKKLSAPDKIFHVYSWEPLKEEGVYIKIDEETTTRELINLFREVKNFRLAINIVSNKKVVNPPRYQQKRRKDISKKDNIKGYVYEKVEQNIIMLSKEKATNKHYSEDLYSKELIKPAVEMTVDDFFDSTQATDNQRDNNWEKVEKRINGYYYDIIERYKLPTYRDLNRLLRLMNS